MHEAYELAKRVRAGSFDAVVGIGGGRTLDVAKLASTLGGLPMVAVATSLAHDGIASPVASLEEGGRKGSFGVQIPIALVVDLDYVRRSEPEIRRSGIGDVISNLSAIADWQLAGRERGEPVDGVAVTFARTAATSILHRTDGVDDLDFLIALAEALVLSGLAMARRAPAARAAAATTRSCTRSTSSTPAPPGTASWPARRACSARCCATTRDGGRHRRLPAPPRAPAHARASSASPRSSSRPRCSTRPATRPDRYTVLEHLALGEQEVAARVREFAAAFA